MSKLSYHSYPLYIYGTIEKGQAELPKKKEMTFHDGTRLSPHYLVGLNTIHYFHSLSSSLKYLHPVQSTCMPHKLMTLMPCGTYYLAVFALLPAADSCQRRETVSSVDSLYSLDPAAVQRCNIIFK